MGAMISDFSRDGGLMVQCSAGYVGDYIGNMRRLIQGYTRSFDCSSNGDRQACSGFVIFVLFAYRSKQHFPCSFAAQVFTCSFVLP